MRQLQVLGVNLKDYSVRESMRRVTLYMNSGICNTIDFITHDVLLKASDSESLKESLEKMDMTVCTSGDILEAGNVMSRSREKEIESNLLLKGMLRKFSKEKRGLYLISDTEEQVSMLGDSLNRLYEGLNIIGSCALEKIPGSIDAAVNEVNSFLPDVLFLKLPTPKAEEFIEENRMKLNTQLIVALRDTCLKVTEDGRVKRGGLKNLLLKKFFHSAAKKYEKTELESQESGFGDGSEGGIKDISGIDSDKIVQFGPREKS